MYQCATFRAKMSLKMIELNKMCVWEKGGGGGGGGDVAIKLLIIIHFLCGRSRTRLKFASEIWNLDLNLESRI